MLQRMMKTRFEPKIAPKAATKPSVSVKAPAKRDVAPAKGKADQGARKPRVVDDIGFAPGDHVVYPTHGVGQITAVESQVIGGQMLRLLVIQFEKDRMTLRVPVTKAKTSGLRRLSTRKEMQTALVTLKGRSRVKRTMWSRRAQEYEAKINSGDPRSIAEVVRDLHRNADQPDQSFSERQMYQAALDRLVRELAVVERITEQSATERLETILKVA